MNKTEEHTNISIEDAMKTLQEKRNEILEAFAKAYLAETSLNPSEVELVTQQMPIENGIIEHRYFFRKKND